MCLSRRSRSHQTTTFTPTPTRSCTVMPSPMVAPAAACFSARSSALCCIAAAATPAFPMAFISISPAASMSWLFRGSAWGQAGEGVCVGGRIGAFCVRKVDNRLWTAVGGLCAYLQIQKPSLGAVEDGKLLLHDAEDLAREAGSLQVRCGGQERATRGRGATSGYDEHATSQRTPPSAPRAGGFALRMAG